MLLCLDARGHAIHWTAQGAGYAAAQTSLYLDMAGSAPWVLGDGREWHDP